MEKLRIRNSMLSDWEEMCHLAFRARWFGTAEERQLMDIGHLEAIKWGSYFEQLVLGSGVGGKIVELTDKMYRSDYYERTKRQAETAREFIFNRLGVPFIAAQVQMVVDIEIEGMTIPTEGNADALLGYSKVPSVILDTKFTGDTTNEYGKYAWGKPETMDMGQLVMYTEQAVRIYNLPSFPRSIYYVADRLKSERVEVIEPEFTQEYRQWYLWKLKEAYQEISQSYNFNYWTDKASYNNCRNCPLRDQCNKAVKVPEIKKIIK